jgi:hypothetical protein
MIVALLICHGLVAFALMGAITHQAVALTVPKPAQAQSFPARYASVNSATLRNAVIVLYVISFILGSLIYPTYRLDVRIPLEELRLGWAIGLFELKEHFGGLGLATLPLYAYYWNNNESGDKAGGRTATTLLLACIVWFDFLAGHVVNNIRGI